MKNKRKNSVPYPYSKWITFSGWKKIPLKDRKILIDLIKLQNRMWKKYPKYHNMNAEVEYLKSIGEH